MCFHTEWPGAVTPPTHVRGVASLNMTFLEQWDVWDLPERWDLYSQRQLEAASEISPSSAIVLLERDISHPREFMLDENHFPVHSVQVCKDDKDPMHHSVYTCLRGKLFLGCRQDNCLVLIPHYIRMGLLSKALQDHDSIKLLYTLW